MARVIVSIFVLITLIGSISAARHPRIVGGDAAAIKYFPYVVSLRLFGKDFCGGAIISDRHILTAAHCMDIFRKDYIRIHSGTSSINEKGVVNRIRSVHIHPKWGSSNSVGGYPHNIAVLTLEQPIIFDKYQQKINLPSHDVQNYQVGYLVGWGRTSSSIPIHPRSLQKLQVRLLSSDKCKLYIHHDIIDEQLCAFRSIDTGACFGDSGGPLVSRGEIVEIASFIGEEGCAAGVPDIYTNVYAYKDFIESVINNNQL